MKILADSANQSFFRRFSADENSAANMANGTDLGVYAGLPHCNLWLLNISAFYSVDYRIMAILQEWVYMQVRSRSRSRSKEQINIKIFIPTM